MRIRLWSGLTIRQKLLLFSVIIVAGTAFIGYSVYKNDQKLIDSERWVNHTEDVINKSEKIRSLSNDIESSGKGFVITNDSELLKPLYNAEKNIFTDIGLLKKLTQDNLSQQKRIDSLSSYTVNLLHFSSELIKIRSKEGLSSAIAYSSAKPGNKYSDSIKNIINAIQYQENFLLKKRKQNNEYSISIFKNLSILVFFLRLVFIAILIIAANKYLHQNIEKEKQKAALIIANKQLSFQNKEKEKQAAEIHRIKTDKEALINGIDDLIWSIDDKLCIITANDAYLEMMEIITGKIRAEGDLVLLKEFGEELNNKWTAYYNRALSNERFTVREKFYNPKKQTTDYGLISFNPMYNQQEKVYGVACYSKDITEETITLGALQNAKEELNKIMDSSPDLICTFDGKGKFKKINAAAERILGYTPQELIGTAYLSVVYLPDREKTNNAALEVLTGVNMTNFENSCVHKNGSLVPFTWSVSWNENDKLVYGVGKDATEKKKAEKQIRESEKRFRQIVETAQEGIWMIDVNSKTTFVNKKMCEILEYTQEEMIGKTNLFFKDAEEQKIALEQIERRKKGFKETHESRFITKSGRNIWTQVSTNPILDDDGNYTGALAMITDITKRKLEQEELKKLSLIAKETVSGIMIRDLQQNITWINAAFTNMYGYELSEVIGKNPGDFLHGPDTEANILVQIREHLKNNKPFAFEITHYTKTGFKKNVRVLSQPVFSDEGCITQYFAILTDITKEKELEARVELEKIIKQKEITDAVITAQESERSEIGREMHDNINQLLSASRLYIDTARKDDINRESLLNDASKFALSAIEEIRKLSKALISPSLKEVGLKDSIKDLAKEIMHVHPVKIFFNTNNFKEDIYTEKFIINIFRIVQEQINNIIKHANAKKIDIKIEENRDDLSLTIIDNGIGFDTAKKCRGIGINNIKSRGELYNGTVSLTSQPGHGTSLHIIFNKKDLLNQS